MSSVMFESCDMVNEVYCNKLSKLTYTQFKDICARFSTDDKIRGINIDIENDDELKEHKHQFKMLVNYCRDMKTNNYNLPTKYNYSKYYNNNGRIFLNDKYGLQRIWSVFRGVLCDGIYSDFDMINAHPTILLYICKKYNIYCGSLNDYVNNRDKHLENMVACDGITKNDAKLLYIKCINFNKPIAYFNKKKIRYDAFIRFDDEMKTIQNILITKETDLFTYIKKVRPDNIGGCLVNQLLCNYENEILQKVIKYNRENKKYIVRVPLFDGFMALNPRDKNPIDYIPTLNEISNEYGIKWSVKDHNVALKSMLDTMDINENDDVPITGSFEDLVECSKYLLSNVFKNKIFKCLGRIFYSKDEILFTDDQNIIKLDLFAKLCNYDIWIETPKKEYPLKAVINDIDKVVKVLMTICETNDKFYYDLYDSTLHKLCFKNGYYDFNTKEFKKYTPDIKTAHIVEKDYLPIVPCEDINDVFRKVIYPIFSVVLDKEGQPIKDERFEYMQYQLTYLSRRLAGFNEDKQWAIWHGTRNTGKSALVDFIKYTYGNYIGCPSSQLFFNKTISEDPNKQNGWLIDYQYKRLIICQELPGDRCESGDDNSQYKPTRQETLNGGLVKSICSGGDSISARRLHENPIDFRMQASILFCGNNIPTFNPADCEVTMNLIHTKTVFATQEKIDSLEPAIKQAYIFHIIDPTIKTDFIRQDKYQQALIHILINAFNNPTYASLISIRDKEDNENISIDSDLDNLTKVIQITTNDSDYVSCSDIKKSLTRTNATINNTKLGNLIQQMGGVKFRTSASKGYKRVKLLNLDYLDYEMD